MVKALSPSPPSTKLLRNPEQVGQDVQVRITEVNPENNTVNLSMVPADQVQKRRGGRGDDYGEGTPRLIGGVELVTPAMLSGALQVAVSVSLELGPW